MANQTALPKGTKFITCTYQHNNKKHKQDKPQLSIAYFASYASKKLDSEPSAIESSLAIRQNKCKCVLKKKKSEPTIRSL